MNALLLRRVDEQGKLENLGNGERGVRVTIQYQPRLMNMSRQDQRDFLYKEFNRLSEPLVTEGAEVRLNSISDLAQTVEAVLPLARYEAIETILNEKGFRVDPIVTRQVV